MTAMFDGDALRPSDSNTEEAAQRAARKVSGTFAERLEGRLRLAAKCYLDQDGGIAPEAGEAPVSNADILRAADALEAARELFAEPSWASCIIHDKGYHEIPSGSPYCPWARLRDLLGEEETT